MEVIVDDCEDWLGFTISKVVRDTTHGQAYHVLIQFGKSQNSPQTRHFSKFISPHFHSPCESILYLTGNIDGETITEY